jgi:low affinity Fe/Cu permease
MTDLSDGLTFFDKFASRASELVSRAWFFLLCVLVVVIWAPSFFLFSDVDTWQLIINTLTTIVTFLLVALLQNTQKRSDSATHQKLNAIAGALLNSTDSAKVREELLTAIGLEERLSSK